MAFPAGVVQDITVTSGSYVVSGPTSTTYNGSSLDVYTFTFTGPQTAMTSATEPWPESPLTTDIVFNDSCVPQNDLAYLENYYIRYDGSYTTANGFTNDITNPEWIQTPFRKGFTPQ